MAIACIIFSHQSKLLASSFDLPAIIVNFPFCKYMLYKRSFLVRCLFNCHCFVSTPGVFAAYVMFLLYVYTFTICSCHVILKVHLLTYLLTQQGETAWLQIRYCSACDVWARLIARVLQRLRQSILQSLKFRQFSLKDVLKEWFGLIFRGPSHWNGIICLKPWNQCSPWMPLKLD